MAQCMKTGACVLLEEYGTYLVCDVYKMSGTYILYAISQPQYEQPREVTHRCHIGNGWYKNRSGNETTIVVPAGNLIEV